MDEKDTLFLLVGTAFGDSRCLSLLELLFTLKRSAELLFEERPLTGLNWETKAAKLREFVLLMRTGGVLLLD